MAEGSAILRRYIGRQFTEMRRRAGLTQERAAEVLQRARATVARIEDGDHRVRFRDVDVEAMLKLYGATPEERERMLALTADTRNGHRKSWLHDYTMTALPRFFAPYVELEQSAEVIRQYEPELIPGLLQTGDYAAEVMAVPAGYLSAEESAERVRLRMERQVMLTQPRAPHLDVIINEGVLYRLVGGAEVMTAQLRHLSDASRQTGISVRVLPYRAGVHGGMAASAFTLLDFPTDPRTGEPLEPPMAYIDTLTGAMYLNKPDSINGYRMVWDDLTTRALNETDSRALVSERLKEVST